MITFVECSKHSTYVMTESIIIRDFGPIADMEIDDVRPFLFLIGPSGSGKSTFMKLMAFLRWSYKMMCIRSFLYYSGVKKSSFRISFRSHLKTMGMEKFLKSNSYIKYSYGNFAIVYDGKLRFPQKFVPRDELSLEKISFISDKRNLIGDVLENNLTIRKSAYYLMESFDNYKTATDEIKLFKMPGLGVELKIKKTSNGVKHTIEPIGDASYSINLNESSSGTQSSMPLGVIMEYLSKKFDIVESLNDSMFKYASKTDSLRDFKAVSNVGDLPNRRVSVFIEEPEISLFPASQRQLLDMLVGNCNYTEGYSLWMMVATHSPYLINHLNVLLRRGADSAHINPVDLCVYNVVDGKLQSLMSIDVDSGESVVDTIELSEPMEDIYNEYESLGS